MQRLLDSQGSEDRHGGRDMSASALLAAVSPAPRPVPGTQQVLSKCLLNG